MQRRRGLVWPIGAVNLCIPVCPGGAAMRMRPVEGAALRLQHREFRCCGSELNGFCMVKVYQLSRIENELQSRTTGRR